jgi:mannitol-1-/sugar-/sorbitol-6-/2-deoxyglucose-6-phosphatase
MKLNTVIFDMDGLLIDSEPCWEEAGKLALASYDIVLSHEEYASTIGLRTREWIDWWFTRFGVDKQHASMAEKSIIDNAIRIIGEKGEPMPGVNYIIEFFQSHNFNIGLATSSPIGLVEVVADKLNIRHHLKAISSAENLEHGKPHPEVYLDCAKALKVSPLQCICFEDSFNGMLAAKAARMKCVVIPAANAFEFNGFGAADLKLRSLEEFGEAQLNSLIH